MSIKACLLGMTVAALATTASAQAVTADKVFGIKIPTAPLTIQTEPTGARIVVAYGTKTDAKTVECVSPCTVNIPKNRNIAFAALLDGYDMASRPQLKWVDKGLRGYVLEPSSITIQMKPKQ